MKFTSKKYFPFVIGLVTVIFAVGVGLLIYFSMNTGGESESLDYANAPAARTNAGPTSTSCQSNADCASYCGSDTCINASCNLSERRCICLNTC